MIARLLLLISVAWTASLCGSRADDTLPSAMKNSLVSVQGKGVHNFDSAALSAVKYFGIYYSASWCPPCQIFTPKLVEFYQRVKPQHPEFEVIFISSDESLPAMEAYMKGDAMPWPALAFAKKAMKKGLTRYAGPGIPCLVLVDAAGKVLSHSYEGTNYVGPYKVLRDIETTLQSQPAVSAPASPTPTAPASGSESGSGSSSMISLRRNSATPSPRSATPPCITGILAWELPAQTSAAATSPAARPCGNIWQSLETKRAADLFHAHHLRAHRGQRDVSAAAGAGRPAGGREPHRGDRIYRRDEAGAGGAGG